MDKELEAVLLELAKRELENRNQPERGLGRRAIDWLTGARREEGIPTGFGAGLGMETGKAAQMTALMTTTASDERLMEGITRIEPSAQFDRDEFGNLIAVIPQFDEQGREISRRRFYPNPQGLDLTDVMIGSGAAALATPVARAVQAIGLPTRGLLGGATVGGTEAALVEGASSQLAGVPFQKSDVPVGAAGGLLASPIANIVGRIVARGRSNPASVIGPDGRLLPEVANEIRAMGINPDDLTAEIVANLRRDVALGAMPGPALAFSQAKTLPVPVPMTAGQISGSKGQQLFEDAARSGAWGSLAESIMRGQLDQAQGALRANIEAITERMAPGQVPMAMGQGGAAVQEALLGMRTAAKRRATEAYTAARAVPGVINPQVTIDMSDAMRAAYREGFSPRTAPTVAGLLDDFDEIAQSGDIKSLMAWRQQVGGLRAGVPTVESAAAANVIEAFDNQMNRVAQDALILGDEQSVARWYDAISTHKDYAQTWKNKGGILNLLTEQVTRDGSRQLKVPPESVSNIILGSSIGTMAAKTGAARDLATLKAVLPREQWDKIRQEAFLRLAMQAEGPVVQGTRQISGAKFLTGWEGFLRKNPVMAETLFNESERKLISQFGSVAARVTNAAANTSNSANAAAGMIQRLAAIVGGTNIARLAGSALYGPLIRLGTGTVRAASATRGGLKTGYGPTRAAAAAAAGGVAASQDEAVQDISRGGRRFMGYPQ